MKVDLSGQVWAQFEQAQTRAKHHLDEGRSEEAAAEYRRCANLLRQYSQYAIDASVRKQRLERAEKFDQLAARIQSGLMGQAVSAGRLSRDRAWAGHQDRRRLGRNRRFGGDETRDTDCLCPGAGA